MTPVKATQPISILTGPVRHAQSAPVTYKQEILAVEDEPGHITMPELTEEPWDDAT